MIYLCRKIKEKKGGESVISLPKGVRFILSRLREKGYEAYIVGGSVRDSLLMKTPRDYDVTTSALPDAVKEIFHDCKTVDTGILHGTVTVLSDGKPFEVTTYRVDGDYSDLRHPRSVSFTRSLREDAARRDFTVNAMAYSDEDGVIDFFGGREDLKNRLIRAVGDPDTRFHEDALRILRALRFAATLDFTVEEKTAAAVKRNKALLSRISAERVREELCRLVRGKAAYRILSEFREVIGEVIPELTLQFDFCQHTPHHIYDLYEHTIHTVDAAENTAVIRMAALLHDIGKPSCFFRDENGVGHFYGHEEVSASLADKRLRALRFDNKTRERIVLLIRKHGVMLPTTERSQKRLLSSLGEEAFFELLSLKRADNAALAPMHADRLKEIDALEASAREILSHKPCLTLSALSVGGDDLIALGVPRGRRIGELLSAALSAVIDGRVENEREALIAFVKKTNDE